MSSDLIEEGPRLFILCHQVDRIYGLVDRSNGPQEGWLAGAKDAC